jgi:hypothetical protein
MTIPHGGPHGLADPGPEPAAPADDRPVTYDDAEATYGDMLLTVGRDRYAELTDRELCARATARLRERGEFDPGNPGHQAVAARQPLGASEYLEHIAIGEALARYYRHPSMMDHAVKAGANWEQIGAARGTSSDQARRDYREWAEGQHRLNTYYKGKFGMSDDEYAAAIARASGPETYPAGIGDPASIGIPSGGKILCAHADQDGQGMHWKLPGETCTAAEQGARLEAGQ